MVKGHVRNSSKKLFTLHMVAMLHSKKSYEITWKKNMKENSVAQSFPVIQRVKCSRVIDIIVSVTM